MAWSKNLEEMGIPMGSKTSWKNLFPENFELIKD